MARGTTAQTSPRGLRRLALRLPIWLYRLGLGGLLGQRFLLLSHRGRTSGKLRQTVLEVVQHDQAMGAYIVASGWGEQAQWLQNILRTPEVTIQVGRQRMPAHAVRLPTDQAATALLASAQQHPAAFRALSKLMVGEPLTPDRAGCTRLAAHVPVVALVYRRAGDAR